MANNYSQKHKEKLLNKAQDIKIFPMKKKQKKGQYQRERSTTIFFNLSAITVFTLRMSHGNMGKSCKRKN